jgi:N-methylhydantoinase B
VATTLHKGDRLVIETAGGGGYGDPLERSGAHVREDVRNGKISEDAASAAYGRSEPAAE